MMSSPSRIISLGTIKEQFRHILPPLLEEVRTYVNDML